MPVIEVRKENVNVDVRAEIEAFDWGYDAKWSDDKLIARSPFRDDSTPSFFVRLQPHGEYPAGIWSDSGADDSSYYKGGFVKLLAFLRHESMRETEDYLLDKYAQRGGKRKLIPPRIARERSYPTLDESLIEVMPSPYLSRRGISEEAQMRSGTGRGQYKGYVALPWRFPDGRLMNVKYRATKGKMFFYEDDAYPIGKLVWGADSVGKGDGIIICEAEIDALSWRSVGFEAVATGHGALSEEQAEIIRGFRRRRLVAGGDNDTVGKRFNAQIKRVLGDSASIGEFDWSGYSEKDANELLQSQGIDGMRKLAGTVEFPRRINKKPLK